MTQTIDRAAWEARWNTPLVPMGDGHGIDCGDGHTAVMTITEHGDRDGWQTILGGSGYAHVVKLRDGATADPEVHRDASGRVLATVECRGLVRLPDDLSQVAVTEQSREGFDAQRAHMHPPVEGWPQPRYIPERGYTDPFPTDALPDLMADAVREVSSTRQGPEAVSATAFLAVASGLVGIGTSVDLYGPGSHGRCNGYFAVVAGTGDGKTPNITPAFQALATAQREVSDEYKRAQAKRTAELAILKARRREQTRDEDGEALAATEARIAELEAIRPPRVFMDDATPEALEDRLAENDGRMILFNDEGAYMDHLAGRYGNRPNLGVWLKGYDGTALSKDRVNKDAPSVVIREPRLAVLAAVQPVFMYDVIRAGGIAERGGIARLLIAYPAAPERVYHTGTRTPDVAIHAWNDHVLKLWRKGDRTLHVTPQAYGRWDDWRNQMLRDQRRTARYEQVSEFLPKYLDYVGRIAGLLTALERQANVTEGHMDRAIRIVEWYLASVLNMYGEIGGHVSLAQKMLKWIQAGNAADLWVPREYNRHGPGKGKPAADVYAALEVLEDHGWVRTSHPDGFTPPGRGFNRGNKPPQVELHPQLLEARQ